MTVKVSIIMSVYSESTEQLSKSIDSILHQSFTDFEYIIVLDNPLNLEAKSYISLKEKEDQRIIFLENKENIKLWASLNHWINIAKGKYIARMDGDDTCDINKFEKQYAYIEKHKNIDLLFTWWEEINEKNEKNIRIPSQRDFRDINKTFFYKSPLLHASMMCKREIFDIYSYPEIDRPEDFSLFLELIAHGYTFDVLEEVMYSFYIQTYDLKTKYKKIRIFSSNFLNILSKNILKYWNNIYFWWMLFLVIIQWILSRNRLVFWMFFGWLQRVYKNIFL